MKFENLLAKLRTEIVSISAKQLNEKMSLKDGLRPIVIDVRELEELQTGTILGARHIPRSSLESNVRKFIESDETPVVLYCAGGVRSVLAARSMLEMGFRSVVSLEGGFEGWRRDGHPVEPSVMLDGGARRRYARQIVLAEIGEAGQKNLSNSMVVVIGAGGLGSPCLLYLAAAGVGSLRIVDFDKVELSNLHRQILHSEDRLGLPKVQSASAALTRLNSSIVIDPKNDRISIENVAELLRGADLVVDGSDNFETRYVVADHCQREGIALLFAGVFRFEGQVAFFKDSTGPCLRCLYPEEAPPELAPSCQQAGVLGAFVGHVGSIQATEAIRFLATGKSGLNSGELLFVDGRSWTARRLTFERRANCPNHKST